MRSGPLPDWKQKVPPLKSTSLLLRYSTALKWRCERYSLAGGGRQEQQQQQQVQCQGFGLHQSLLFVGELSSLMSLNSMWCDGYDCLCQRAKHSKAYVLHCVQAM